MKETLNKNPIDKTNSIVSFVNGVSEDYLKTMEIKDIIPIITWERKIVGKHKHLDTVHNKINITQHQVKMFIGLFTPLFKMGLPSFWEESGKLLSQVEYHAQLVITRNFKTKWAS